MRDRRCYISPEPGGNEFFDSGIGFCTGICLFEQYEVFYQVLFLQPYSCMKVQN